MDDFYAPMWTAQQVLRMHSHPVRIEDDDRDPHARWLNRHRGQLYRAGGEKCASCRDDGCPLLDAAQFFVAVVSPYLDSEVTVAKPRRIPRAGAVSGSSVLAVALSALRDGAAAGPDGPQFPGTA